MSQPLLRPRTGERLCGQPDFAEIIEICDIEIWQIRESVVRKVDAKLKWSVLITAPRRKIIR
jgi:hypothetical protein